MALKPKNFSVWENLGTVYYELGQYKEAIEASSESVRLNSKPPGPHTFALLSSGRGHDLTRGHDLLLADHMADCSWVEVCQEGKKRVAQMSDMLQLVVISRHTQATKNASPKCPTS